MPDLWMDVDVNLAEVPVNLLPLLDDTDFKAIEASVAYDAAGLALYWHFVTSAGAYTVTSVTPTTGGNYDWTDQGDAGIYTIEIPASGGASINNDTEGFGWFTGKATGVLPWRGPVIGFRRAALNDLMIEGGTASTNLEDFFDGTGYAGGTTKLITDAVLNATQGSYAPAKAGDAMTLADDAITSAKYDESTAFPVKSADTGSTALARTGADSDTLETLSDQIDGAALEATLTAIKGAGWSTETLAAIDALINAVKAKTDLIPASPAAVGSAMTLTSAYDAAKTAAAAGAKMDIVDAPNATGLSAIADAFLKRDWTSVTGEATRSVLNALRPLLNKWTSASGAGGYVVKKEDDSTTAWTGTLTVDENGNISGMDHD